MKTTCIIPTCDRPEMLREALASVFEQTAAPDEIIVVNNGKAPVTFSAEYEKKVRVVTIMPYAGVAQARNFGAVLATGDILAFLDDDDFWSKDYLKNVKTAFEKGAVCVVSRLDKKTSGVVHPFKNADGKITIKDILVVNPGITGSNLAIKRDVFFTVGGFDPKLPPSEDKSLVLELLRKNIDVTVLPKNQAIIREHEGTRLSGSRKIAEGIRQFTMKYRDLMGWEEYLYNRKKIFWYRYQAGMLIDGILYAIFGICLKVVKLFNKLKK